MYVFANSNILITFLLFITWNIYNDFKKKVSAMYEVYFVKSEW